jgi:hypothetical protein
LTIPLFMIDPGFVNTGTVSADHFVDAWTRPPVWDTDGIVANFVLHPIMGAEAYLTVRNRDYGPIESLLFSTGVSVGWEYLFESWVERPSIQDLLITSNIGSLQGELRFQIRRRVARWSPSVGRNALLILVDPVEALHRYIGKTFLHRSTDATDETMGSSLNVATRSGEVDAHDAVLISDRGDGRDGSSGSDSRLAAATPRRYHRAIVVRAERSWGRGTAGLAACAALLVAGCGLRLAPSPGTAPWRDVAARSVLGDPIEVFRCGQEGGGVLVVGGVHGDERGGAALVRELTIRLACPDGGGALTIVPVLNPDGLYVAARANARGVDLNRNLPTYSWVPAPAHGGVAHVRAREPSALRRPRARQPCVRHQRARGHGAPRRLGWARGRCRAVPRGLRRPRGAPRRHAAGLARLAGGRRLGSATRDARAAAGGIEPAGRDVVGDVRPLSAGGRCAGCGYAADGERAPARRSRASRLAAERAGPAGDDGALLSASDIFS